MPLEKPSYLKEPSRPHETGLIGGIEKRDVVIHDYNEKWPAMFKTQRKIIAGVLGKVALRIEHIGSTSVPGLAAKPIIDILVVVPDSANEASYLTPLIDAGYELRVREPDLDEHRMLRTPGRDVHIHVFSPTSKEIDRYLVFRNRLRENPADRQRYEKLKRTLAQKDWADMNEYADAKSEVIENIIASGLLEPPDRKNTFD